MGFSRTRASGESVQSESPHLSHLDRRECDLFDEVIPASVDGSVRGEMHRIENATVFRVFGDP